MSRARQVANFDPALFAADEVSGDKVSGGTIGAGVIGASVTGGAGLTGSTSLGTVTAGNLSNTAIVYPGGQGTDGTPTNTFYGGHVLQVVSTTNGTGASTTSGTPQATSCHTLAITTSVLNSKLLVTMYFNPQITGTNSVGETSLRSSVDSYASNLAFVTSFDTAGIAAVGGDYNMFTSSICYLHAPDQAASTAITYKSYISEADAGTYKMGDYWVSGGYNAMPKNTTVIMEIAP